MKGKKIFFVSLVLLFIAGIWGVFAHRFQKGDIYPPMSSMNAGPLGAKGLFETLSGIDYLHVKRNTIPYDEIRNMAETSFFILGITPFYFETYGKDFFFYVHRLASEGNRVVIVFSPVKPKPRRKKEKKEEKEKGHTEKEIGWGLRLETMPMFAENWKAKLAPEPNIPDFLPKNLSFRSALFFSALSSPWKPLYTMRGKTVAMEMQAGKGKILFMTDPYFLSNEGMIQSRKMGLISYLVGKNPKVVFDEYIHGIRENKGIMGLARQKGLGGFFLGMGAVALLILWQMLTPFIPGMDSSQNRKSSYVIFAEGDAHKGLVNLLERHIPVSRLLFTCVNQWEKTPGKQIHASLKSRVRKIAEGGGNHREAEIVAAYNRIREVVSGKPDFGSK